MKMSAATFVEDARNTYGDNGLDDILGVIGVRDFGELYSSMHEAERMQFLDEKFTSAYRGRAARTMLDILRRVAPRLVPVPDNMGDLSDEILAVGMSPQQATYLSILAGPAASIGFSASADIHFDRHSAARTEHWSVWHEMSAGVRTRVEISRFNYVPPDRGEEHAVYRLSYAEFGPSPSSGTVYVPMGTGFDHVSEDGGLHVGKWSVVGYGVGAERAYAYSYVNSGGETVSRTVDGFDAGHAEIPNGYAETAPAGLFVHTWEHDTRPSGYANRYAARMVDVFRDTGGSPDPSIVEGWLPAARLFFVSRKGGSDTVAVSGSKEVTGASLVELENGAYTLRADGMSDVTVGSNTDAYTDGAQVGERILSSPDGMARVAGRLQGAEFYRTVAEEIFPNVNAVSQSEWPVASRSDKAEAGSLLALPILLAVLMVVAVTHR